MRGWFVPLPPVLSGSSDGGLVLDPLLRRTARLSLPFFVVLLSSLCSDLKALTSVDFLLHYFFPPYPCTLSEADMQIQDKQLTWCSSFPLSLGSTGATVTMVSCTGGGRDELAWLSRRHCLHLGQDEWELSQLSMHWTWNPWLHIGRIRMRSPCVKSDRHMTHSESKPGGCKSAE